jgi:hypothetical protein
MKEIMDELKHVNSCDCDRCKKKRDKFIEWIMKLLDREKKSKSESIREENIKLATNFYEEFIKLNQKEVKHD